MGERVGEHLGEVLDVAPLIDDEWAEGAELYYRFIDTRQLRHLRRSLEETHADSGSRG